VANAPPRARLGPSVATRQSNLALVLLDLGDLPRAKELLEQALAADLRNLGPDHPSVAISRFNLARICIAQDDFAGACASLAQTLAAEERSLGADHPSTAYTRASLAHVLSRLGDAESARNEAGRAVRAVADQPPGSYYRRLVEDIASQLL
jgi:tetratricopeptide (TPR) repeat protein